MLKIALSNQKGGVGKTTSTGILSAALSGKGLRVLAVDADPQGSLSSWLLTEAPPHELADVLQGRASLQEAAVPIRSGLELLPTFGIGGGLRTYAEGGLEAEPYIVRELAEEAERAGYDALLIDTAPENGRLSRAVLLGVEEVLLPMELEAFSWDGIELFRDHVEKLQKGFRHQLIMKKIILNKVNAGFRRNQLYREEAGTLGLDDYEIPQDSTIGEAQILHRIPESGRAAEAFRKLAAALRGKGAKHGIETR